MALVITAGSLFYYLNRSSHTMLSEEFIVVPHNVEIPSKAEKRVAKKNPNLQPESGTIDKKPIINPTEKKDLPGTRIPLSTSGNEAFVITQNSQNAPLVSESSDLGFSNRFSGALMPDAYRPFARPDQIPRNKKAVVANWEMLTASYDFPVEEIPSGDHLLLTAQVSPTYSYRDIGTLDANGPGQFNEFESGRISYSGGLQFGFKTSDRLSVHTGIMYSKLGYNINQVGSYYISKASSTDELWSGSVKQSTIYEVRNSIGTITQASAKGDFVGSNEVSADVSAIYADADINASPNMQTQVVGKIEQFFQYLEIPFLLRYKVLDNKLGVNLLGGVSTNILVGNKATFITQDQDRTTGSSENVRSFNYMGNMGLGFDYKLNKNMVLTMEPQFKYFLNSINQSSLISNHPYMFGLFTGVRFVW
jgi:hypothetical protein